MKKNFKIATLFIIILFLYSCQTAKDALQGQKRSEQSDEFLVEKKNPLTIPPDFEKLPIPGEEESYLEDKSNIKELIIENNEENNSTENNQTGYLEVFILRRIQ